MRARRSSSPNARTSRSTSACSRTRASIRGSKRYLMLKSRIHYRAGFKPIASHIVECAGEGVTNADLSVYPYRETDAAHLSARSDVGWRPSPQPALTIESTAWPTPRNVNSAC